MAKKIVDVRYDISPLRAVGPLKFGMKRADVDATLGPAEFDEYDDVMERHHQRRGEVRFEFERDRLISVEFRRGASVYYKDADMFTTKDIVATLKADDPETDEDGGYMNCPSLGIWIGGFGKRRVEEGKSVVVYGKKFIEHFKTMLHA